MANEKTVLFVCLGNICRSPMAEAILRHMVTEQGLQGWNIDSAAIGPWHIGKRPDKRCLTTLRKHGMETDHKARQTGPSDFKEFKYIFGFDEDNISDLMSQKSSSSDSQIKLLGEYDPQKELIIEDPYYTTDKEAKAFEVVYQQCHRCLQNFLDQHK